MEKVTPDLDQQREDFIDKLLKENHTLKARIMELEGVTGIKYGDLYFIPDIDEPATGARNYSYEWETEPCDYHRLQNGLLFKTREEANALANDILCYTRLRKAYKDYWSTTVPTESGELFTLSRPMPLGSTGLNKFIPFVVVECQERTDIFRFTSKEDAESFLKDNNEDLLKFYSVWND